MQNFVEVSGVVESIDLEKRDISLITETSGKRKPVRCVIHMWKCEADGDDAAWAGRINWKEILHVGSTIKVVGHMGNNGRIIATNYNDFQNNPSDYAEGCDDEDDCEGQA